MSRGRGEPDLCRRSASGFAHETNSRVLSICQPSPHCGTSSEQNTSGPWYRCRHEAGMLGWTGIEAQGLSVPPDSGPGSQVLVKGFGLESPSFACPEPVCLATFLLWKPGKPLNSPLNRREESLEKASDWPGLSPANW